MTSQLYILLIISITGVAMIIIGFIAVQVRNQKRMLQKQNVHQKDLLEAVIRSQEAERERIGSDLHDEVGTLLSSLRITIDKYSDTRASELIDRVVVNVRRVAHNLSPHIKGEFGCYDALMELCSTVDMAGAVRVNAAFNEEDIPSHVNESTALSVYRIIAELLNNTLKHANATEITLKMEVTDNKWQIHYSDNGKGFAITDKNEMRGMGWKNIESRVSIAGGSHSITSAPGTGLNVILTIPAN